MDQRLGARGFLEDRGIDAASTERGGEDESSRASPDDSDGEARGGDWLQLH